MSSSSNLAVTDGLQEYFVLIMVAPGLVVILAGFQD